MKVWESWGVAVRERDMLAEGETDDKVKRDDDRWFNEELTGWKKEEAIRRQTEAQGEGRKGWRGENERER